MFIFADPEELLNSLLSQTLRAAPFLELSSGQTAHLYQLFVERDESKSLPSVQELFEQSFLTSGVKLKRVPSVLVLQMPRFGRQFKVYDRILPSQILDVTDVIEDGKSTPPLKFGSAFKVQDLFQDKYTVLFHSSKAMYCVWKVGGLGVCRVLWRSRRGSG